MQRNGGFSSEWLDKLRYNSDIVTTISKYVSLNRKGGTYWACCPFHHEKTPSFAVNQQGQFFHCFGCGVGGDVIKFVEMIEESGSNALITSVRAFHNPSPIKVKFDRAIKEFE